MSILLPCDSLICVSTITSDSSITFTWKLGRLKVRHELVYILISLFCYFLFYLLIEIQIILYECFWIEHWYSLYRLPCCYWESGVARSFFYPEFLVIYFSLLYGDISVLMTSVELIEKFLVWKLRCIHNVSWKASKVILR